MQQLSVHRLNPQTDTNRNISKIARAFPLVAYLGRKTSQIGRSTLSITSLDYRRASRRLTPETPEGVMMLLFANDSSSSFLSNVQVHQIRPTQRTFLTSTTFPPPVNPPALQRGRIWVTRIVVLKKISERRRHRNLPADSTAPRHCLINPSCSQTSPRIRPI